VVLDEVAQRARLVVVAGARADPMSSAAVIWMWSMKLRFQTGSNM
jgi:hypothetical protein